MFTSVITSALLLVVAVLNPVQAGVYITNPVDSTTAVGGQTLTVKWADDGNSPTLASIGPCSIDIYTGSRDQQTGLQNLAASVDVSKASSVTATINPTIGSNGDFYFVRFTSASLKDATNPQYPYEAFSAVFTLTGMTGQFNASVLAQIQATGGVTSSVIPSATAGSNAAVTASSAKTSASASTSAKSAANPKVALSAGLLMGLVGAATYLVL